MTARVRNLLIAHSDPGNVPALARPGRPDHAWSPGGVRSPVVAT